MNWFEREMDRRGRETERRVLLRLLRQRFGELPAAVVARIEAAEMPELDAWVDRVVTAARLEDVLGAAPA